MVGRLCARVKFKIFLFFRFPTFEAVVSAKLAKEVLRLIRRQNLHILLRLNVSQILTPSAF